LSSICI